MRFFGRGPAHQVVARVVNAVGWCAGAMLAYHAGVAWIGQGR